VKEKLFYQASSKEKDARAQFLSHFKESPIPDSELLEHLALYSRRQILTKTLFFNEIYQKILPLQGIAVEFGVRWGTNLVTLMNLRGIYEPYNYLRKIVGFDTFEGFPDIHDKDGNTPFTKEGNYSVSKNYETYLNQVLSYHEQESPIPHMQKFDLRKGLAQVELKKYLSEKPHTIIAFAYFDMDLYEPTIKCLDLIEPFLTKGAVIAFDNLHNEAFPGETIALREFWGTKNLKVFTSAFSSTKSYIIYDPSIDQI